jgi:hypothetical protein
MPDKSEHQTREVRPHPGDRLEHESKLIDPRRREKKRDLATWGLWSLGAVCGAGLFSFGFWIYATITGTHHSVFPYLLLAAIGAGVLPGLLPYLSLARSDGADANVVQQRGRRGRADAPVEGAEAVDTGRTDEGHARS